MLIVVALAYPFGVHWALNTGQELMLVGLVGLLLLPLVLCRVYRKGIGSLKNISSIGAILMVTISSASAVLHVDRGMLLVPMVTNLVVGWSFGWTLWVGPPMIERFARLVEPQLSAPKVHWCAVWTYVWVGYFGVNMVITSLLTAFAPISWWVIYTGCVTYLLMGILFVVEILGRWYIFGRGDR
ncbi:MAG: hypothetical protein KTR25_16435 [Myxococcales bacterium]|nr:hypothetical protein [Myxococcales bacterium]